MYPSFWRQGEPNCSISTGPRLIRGQTPSKPSAGAGYHPTLSHGADPTLPTGTSDRTRAHNPSHITRRAAKAICFGTNGSTGCRSSGVNNANSEYHHIFVCAKTEPPPSITCASITTKWPCAKIHMITKETCVILEAASDLEKHDSAPRGHTVLRCVMEW